MPTDIAQLPRSQQRQPFFDLNSDCLLRSAAGLSATQTDSAPTDLGNWETSGILDVSKLFGAQPGQVLVFDTQAHSLRDGTITAGENLVEGGQLAFLIGSNANLKQNTSTYTGTPGNDPIEAGITKGFDGVNRPPAKVSSDCCRSGSRPSGSPTRKARQDRWQAVRLFRCDRLLMIVDTCN